MVATKRVGGGRSWGRKILRVLGYVVFFLAATILFTYWTLPFEQIKARYIRIAEQKLGMDIIGKIQKHWFTGIKATNLRLIPRAKAKPAPVATAPGKKPPKPKPKEIEIEEATVRLSILPLFIGRIDLSFAARLASGGEIEGSFTRKSDGNAIAAKIEKLKLASLSERIAGKTVKGEVSGDIDVVLARDAAKSSGKAKLTGSGLKIDSFKIPIAQWGNQPFTVPGLNLGNLDAELEIKDGSAVFKRFGLSGSKDLTASMQGYVVLQDVLSRSHLNAYLKFRLSDGFFKANPKFSILKGALSRAKRRDGFYGYQITGPIGKLAALRRIPMSRAPRNLKPPKPGTFRPGAAARPIRRTPLGRGRYRPGVRGPGPNRRP